MPLIPGLIGFAIAFIVQFRLKHHVDREKVLAIEDMSELYPNSIPPKKVLNEKGRRLHWLLVFGGALFAGSIITTIIMDSMKG